MKKLMFSLIALSMFAMVSCGESDNGNSDELNMFCKCKVNAEESDECKEYMDKAMSEYEAADESGKAEITQTWAEMDIMCNQ
jgi:uncharacterized protein YxeA